MQELQQILIAKTILPNWICNSCIMVLEFKLYEYNSMHLRKPQYSRLQQIPITETILPSWICNSCIIWFSKLYGQLQSHAPQKTTVQPAACNKFPSLRPFFQAGYAIASYIIWFSGKIPCTLENHSTAEFSSQQALYFFQQFLNILYFTVAIDTGLQCWRSCPTIQWSCEHSTLGYQRG